MVTPTICILSTQIRFSVHYLNYNWGIATALITLFKLPIEIKLYQGIPSRRYTDSNPQRKYLDATPCHFNPQWPVVNLEDTAKTPAHYFQTTSRHRCMKQVSFIIELLSRICSTHQQHIEPKRNCLTHSLTRTLSVSLLCLSDQQSVSSKAPWSQRSNENSSFPVAWPRIPYTCLMSLLHLRHDTQKGSTGMWCRRTRRQDRSNSHHKCNSLFVSQSQQ